MPDEPTTEPTEPASDEPAPETPTPKDIADKTGAPAGDGDPGDTPAAKPEGPPALTQADVDRIVADRLKRERAKYSDYAELKKAAEELEALKDTDKTETQRLAEQLAELKAENETNKVKALRSEVARTKGVPAELLTAADEDELTEQADALLAYAEAELEKRKPKPKTNDKPPADSGGAKPKEKLRSGAAGSGKSEMSREDLLAAVLGKHRK